MSAPALDWGRDGADWPNRAASRYVEAGSLRWHVQEMGQGPVALLVHGTGASTHSWRDVMPALAGAFRVVAMDLPGHAFTDRPSLDGMKLPGMAHAVGQLVSTLQLEPALVIGHSAGAAILLRMCLDGLITPKLVVSLNGALKPFPGLAGRLLPPLARLLYLNPLAPRLVAMRAGMPGAVARLLAGMGSRLDPTGLAYYERLFATPSHVDGALTMMACWDLQPLARELPALAMPLLLVAGGEDRAIPADDAFRLRDRLPRARVEYVRHLGHLAHEERPGEIVAILLRAAAEAGIAAIPTATPPLCQTHERGAKP